MNTPYQSSDYKMRVRRRTFHALLASLGIMQNKPHLLASYGVDSTMELTAAELDEINHRLKKMLTGKYEPTDAVRRWRSRVLTVLNELGVYAHKGDWSRVNAFLLDSRIAGKLLYEMDTDELKALHRKLLAIKRKQHPVAYYEISLN